MDPIAVIAEYNPFHQGHAYQIGAIKKRHSDSPLIIIMSGSFTQRGIPGLFNKFDRAQWALAAGADVVIELPSVFAMASAEYFAMGALRQIAALGIKKCIFGAKNTSVEVLQTIAILLLSEDFEKAVKPYVQEGLSYASARQKALTELAPELAPLLEDANNLLGISYIRAALAYNLPIEFETISRRDHHHSETPVENYASGTYLRRLLSSKEALDRQYFDSEIAPYLPAQSVNAVYDSLLQGHFSSMERYEDALLLSLKKASVDDIKETYSCSEGLEHRLYQGREASSFTEFLESVKTKRYTYSRLWRLCANLLLGRTEDTVQRLYQAGPQYHHVLGFSTKGQAFMKQYNGDLPMVTKWGAFYRQAALEPTSPLYEMAKMDVIATDIQSFTMMSPAFRQGAKDSRFSPKPFTTL